MGTTYIYGGWKIDSGETGGTVRLLSKYLQGAKHLEVLWHKASYGTRRAAMFKIGLDHFLKRSDWTQDYQGCWVCEDCTVDCTDTAQPYRRGSAAYERYLKTLPVRTNTQKRAKPAKLAREGKAVKTRVGR
jgi:hypothetical protein